MVSALAIDVGTTSVRTALVDGDGNVTHAHQRRLSVATPLPGEVELDANEITTVVLDLAHRSLAGGSAEVVGITSQRATTILFDATTGDPVGPALGWQDLRTVIDCLVLQGEGLRLAPNQSATKLRWLLERADAPVAHLRMATVETWVARVLTQGAVHITDHSNAAVTGLVERDARHWDSNTLAHLGIAPSLLADIVDTMGEHGRATALNGRPADHGAGRRPARVALRPVVRARGRQDHLRHGSHARPRARTGGPQRHEPVLLGVLPGGGGEPRRAAHLGRRGHRALGGRLRGVAAR